VTGASAFNGDVQFTGASYNVTWDKSADDLIFNDNAQACFGTGSDLKIYHNGSNSKIDNVTGTFYLQGDVISLAGAGGSENLAVFTKNGEVQLFYDNGEKLNTVTDGINLTGSLQFADDTNTYFAHPAADVLAVTTAGSERVRITAAGNLNQTIGADAIGFNQTAAGNHYVKNVVNANRTGANGSILALHAEWNGTDVSAIKFRTGDDTTNKDDGHICFETSSADNISEVVRITNDGKIGIGTTSPTRAVVIYEGTSNQTQLQFQNSTTGATSGDGFGVGLDGNEKGFLWNYEGNDTYIGGAGGTSMTIQNGGNIGIGTTTPSTLGSPILAVAGTGTDANLLTLMCNGSSTGDYASLGFRVAGTSSGDYTKAGIFAIRTATSSGYNYLDLVFGFENTADATRVTPTHEKARLTATGDFACHNLHGKNLIINGSMQVAQRATSDTSDAQGYTTVDRWKIGWGGADAIVETHQEVLDSNDTGPWQEGFRYAYKLVNGDQSSGAGAADYVEIQHKVEAQNMASCGWDHTNTGDFATLSFWIRSSVAQNFYGFIMCPDAVGDSAYPFETGSLSANTWTKVTKTMLGESNLRFDNDNGEGLILKLVPFYGTDKTNNSVNLNAWMNYNGAARTPDNTSTWWTTNDATFHVTGVQLERGKVATAFEHLTYAEELHKCHRYYYKIAGTSDQIAFGFGRGNGTASVEANVNLGAPLRASPTITCSGNSAWGPSSSSTSTATPSVRSWKSYRSDISILFGSHSGLTNARATNVFSNSSSDLIFSAEL
jgi:hypothetical protein